MLKTVLTYGAIAGLIAGGGLSVAVLLMDEHGGGSMVVGYLIMLLAFALIPVAIKRHRDVAGGGAIRFWAALALGLGISAVAGVIYVVAWECAVAASGMDFAGSYAAGLIEQKRAAGASAAELAAFTREMDSFRASYADPLFRWPMTFLEIFPVGVIVSLLSAALLRNPRFLTARASGVRATV